MLIACYPTGIQVQGSNRREAARAATRRRRRPSSWLVGAGLVAAAGCGPSDPATVIAFEDATAAAGLSGDGPGHGVAVGDYDRDGWDDVFVAGGRGRTRLYRNSGDGTFEDRTEAAGIDAAAPARSGVWGDLDNDGDLDLFVAVYDAADQLYVNDGAGAFAERAAEAGVDNRGRPYSASLADVDGDGWLDIYVANFRADNALYRNHGDGTFSDVIHPDQTLGDDPAMGTVFFDYDEDGDPDLFATHDGRPNVLFENLGGFRFRDVSEVRGVDDRGFGMGVDVADVDGDGHLDVYVTDLYANRLYTRGPGRRFVRTGAAAKVDVLGMGWGATFLDVDNDGRPDLYVANDSDYSPEPNALLHNRDGASFERVGEDSPIASMLGSYGSASGDFDRDGRVDLVVANHAPGDDCQVFVNRTRNGGNWVAFDLEGTASNRSAIGARVELLDGRGRRQVDEVNAGTGFASSNALTLHFGLGEATKVEALSIHWPSGQVQVLRDLDASCRYRVREGAAVSPCR